MNPTEYDKHQFLFITEDQTIYTDFEITNEDKQIFNDGMLDIINMRTNEIAQFYDRQHHRFVWRDLSRRPQ